MLSILADSFMIASGVKHADAPAKPSNTKEQKPSGKSTQRKS